MRKIIDLTGKRFGRLVVIKKASNGILDEKNRAYWICKCDCGNEKKISGKSLRRGESKSCGCYNKEMASKRFLKDLTGQKFGRWIVVRKAPRKGERTFWLCRCECGKEKEVNGEVLKRGASTSCGCYLSECTSNRFKIEFGLSAKKLAYSNYKRRAIRKNLLFNLSFEQFLELVQQNCYYCGSKPKNIYKTKCNNGNFVYQGIDRLNNDKGYILENCVPCCEECNTKKSSQSYNDFMLWIKKVYSLHGGELKCF